MEYVHVEMKSQEKSQNEWFDLVGKRFNLHPLTYQTLEVIHRQTLMSEYGYKFNAEEVNKGLFDSKLTVSERHQLIRKHIKSQDVLNYGFGELWLGKFELLDSLDNSYRETFFAIERLIEGLEAKYGSHSGTEKLSAAIDDVLSGYIKGVSYHKHKKQNLISCKNGETNFGDKGGYIFFNNYINTCYGVFEKVLEKITDQFFYSRPNVSSFVYEKMNYENEYIFIEEGKFSPEKVKDRRKGNKLNNKVASEAPFRRGLLTEEFEDYLVRKNREWLITSGWLDLETTQCI